MTNHTPDTAFTSNKLLLSSGHTPGTPENFFYFLNTISGASTQLQAQAKIQSQAQAEAQAQLAPVWVMEAQIVIIYDGSEMIWQLTW